jgi:citrate synthase
MSTTSNTSGWQPWKTAISHSDETSLWLRGHDVTTLMRSASFADVVFLLHQSRLPTDRERRLIDAILIAVSDHGPGSPSAAASRVVATGSRLAPEAAIAAGVLAIGDKHAGAGLACMERIAEGVQLVRDQHVPIDEAAARVLAATTARGERFPGLGHRTHTTDPRTAILFDLARDGGVEGDGVAFMRAL